MDISALTNVSADDIKIAAEKAKTPTGADTFANALGSAMGMVNETNSYINLQLRCVTSCWMPIKRS